MEEYKEQGMKLKSGISWRHWALSISVGHLPYGSWDFELQIGPFWFEYNNRGDFDLYVKEAEAS